MAQRRLGSWTTFSAGLALAFAIGGGIPVRAASAGPGADIPWRTHEAEAMRTDGLVLGPAYGPYEIAAAASGERCVKLASAGQYVEFTVHSPANALVVRYCLPDAPRGGGTRSNLALEVNGRRVRTLTLDSHYTWLYGNYPFSNDPAQGKPRDFFDEARAAGLGLKAGDVVRLQWLGGTSSWCILDLVDLEQVAPPLPEPARALSIMAYGAGGRGATDDTAALRACIAAAARSGGTVWMPAGTYRITGDIAVPSNVTIQGAGMWYTTFEGDPALYGHADRRVRFRVSGSHITLSDFAILGRLDYRNDSEPNDGVLVGGCSDSEFRRLWIEHTKVGIWVYNGVNLRVEGCRFRDTIADGINLCVGTSGTVVENCTARGTGDDCFAIWPSAADQGFVGRGPKPGHNVFRRCTGELPFLANGIGLYGGEANRVEDCRMVDITAGCGVLVSTTFPTSDARLGIDNNFSGETVIKGCELLRCGGFDHDWAWRGALQVCMDRRSISGLRIQYVSIDDSLSDGLSIVAPGASKGQGTLSDARLEHVTIGRCGLGKAQGRSLWIRNDAHGSLDIADSSVGTITNDSRDFMIRRD
ncbi:pectate lyase superfamily protein [mine drainage metagenome]|uniref:Pectate lyase superfamily protein n=1 Tax=mine drainage metagenome TaxID=410659 RepID=A0A1J5SQS5_9ZZZZ